MMLANIVAGMERSEIRGRLGEIAIPDCAALHPGYSRCARDDAGNLPARAVSWVVESYF
jgi:hypothetical protein